MADAEARSPEIEKARLAGEQASRRVVLAKKERWPDVTVTAGIMPRWGNFETMWQAGVALNLPVWARQKQSHAIAESEARGEAARSDAETIRQLLRQRTDERRAALAALVESNHLYRTGLLAVSEATVASTLAQYQVGRVTFASVLEALASYLADRNGFLDSIAASQRIDIAEREISLDAPGGPTSGGGASAMRASSATVGSSQPSQGPGLQDGEGAGNGTSAPMSRM